jgi:hypothetical protein
MKLETEYVIQSVMSQNAILMREIVLSLNALQAVLLMRLETEYAMRSVTTLTVNMMVMIAVNVHRDAHGA